MNPQLQALKNWFDSNKSVIQGAAAPILVVAILAMMVLPMPPWLLDTFFTLNIAVALMVMMVAAYMLRPLDFSAFPAILLAIAIASALGPSAINAVIALSAVYTPRTARIVRGSVLVVREMDYVQAALTSGARHGWVIWRHILPNSMAPITVQLTFIFAYAVLAESILSFLGVGPPPPTPSWGSMIAEGQAYLREAPLMALFPGIAIALTAMGLNLLGDGLRDVLDPRLKVQHG